MTTTLSSVNDNLYISRCSEIHIAWPGYDKALTEQSFRIHRNLFQFNGSLKNLLILKETSKAGKTLQIIFSDIYTEYINGPNEKSLRARYYLLSPSCIPALVYSALSCWGLESAS